MARHRESGALVGHTVVAVEADRPEIGDQHDTKRLGYEVLARELQFQRDVQVQDPQVSPPMSTS